MIHCSLLNLSNLFNIFHLIDGCGPHYPGYLEPEPRLPRFHRHMGLVEIDNRKNCPRWASRDRKLLPAWIHRNNQRILSGHGLPYWFHFSLYQCRPDHLLPEVRNTEERHVLTCLYRDLTDVYSAYDFDCNDNTYWAYFDATTLPCTSHWPSEGLTTTLTLTYTKLGNRAQSVESYTVTRTSGSSTVTFTTSGTFTTTAVIDEGGTLFALAVAISPPVSTSPHLASMIAERGWR